MTRIMGKYDSGNKPKFRQKKLRDKYEYYM